MPLLSQGHAQAVSKTWDGGCGVDTTWSCANNWSDNIVPGAGDTVIFNSTSTNNSTVDSAVFAGTITTININAGYTGTISLSSSLTVSNTFSQAAGTFTAGSQTLNIGAFVLSAGSFTASSGITSMASMNVSGSPTFNANGGTVNFNASTTATLTCNNITFNLVTIANTAATTTVSSSCNLPLGNNPNANSGGSISNSGTLSGTGTLTTGGVLTLGSSGSLSGFSGLSANILTVNGTYNFGSYTTFAVTGGVFTLNSGAVFTAPSGTASFASTFTINSGSTFNANGGTVNFNGTSGTLSCGSKTFNLVTFNNTSTKTVGSDCSLPLGNNPTTAGGGTGSITLNGTLSGTGTLTTSNTFTLNSGSSLSGFSGLSAVILTINGTYNFGSYSPFSASGSLNLNSGGSFTAPSGTASFASNVNINSGSTFNANGGTININGAGSGAIACNNNSFNIVTFTHTAGVKTVGSDCNLPLGSNPTIGSGTGALTLNGTLSGTGTLTTTGTFTLGVGGSLSGFSGLSTGTVIVNGTYNFGSYSPFTVAGVFTLAATSNFTAPSGTASFASTFTINSGAVFNANGGTVNFNRTVATTVVLTCSNVVFNLVTFTNTSGSTESVSSDCNFPLGNNPTVSSGGSVTLNGTLSGSGTMTKSGGLTLGASGVLTGFSGLTTNSNLTVNGTYNFGSYSPFTVAGAFTLNSGAVFTAPSGTASFSGNFTINAGATFNANGGTVNFIGGGTYTCNNAVFNLVTLNNTGTVTISNGCNFPLGSNPTIGSGGTIRVAGQLTGSGTLNVNSITLRFDTSTPLSGFSALVVSDILQANNTSGGTVDLGSYTQLNIGSLGAFTGAAILLPAGTTTIHGTSATDLAISHQTGSTIDTNGGTVVLTGANQRLTGDTTFYNFTKVVSLADTLTFGTTTTTVQGRLTLKGASGQLLSLVPNTPGSPWYIDAQGTTDVSYVNVSDSHVLGTAITACSSTDSGGNSGWVFNPDSCNPSHGSASVATVSNFESLQAALIHQQQSQNQSPPSFATSGGLPSKLYEFIKQFPAGKGLAKAGMQFLMALVIGLILGLLIAFGFWLAAWRRRKHEEEEEDNDIDGGTSVGGATGSGGAAPTPGSTVEPPSSGSSNPTVASAVVASSPSVSAPVKPKPVVKSPSTSGDTVSVSLIADSLPTRAPVPGSTVEPQSSRPPEDNQNGPIT